MVKKKKEDVKLNAISENFIPSKPFFVNSKSKLHLKKSRAWMQRRVKDKKFEEKLKGGK